MKLVLVALVLTFAGCASYSCYLTPKPAKDGIHYTGKCKPDPYASMK